MQAQKTFNVFGEKVEIFVTSEMSHGSMTVTVQTTPPGGGPPPHIHTREDEYFTVLEGEFEMFDGQSWSPLRTGESHFSLRGGTHTFRNCGSTMGRMHVVISPAGFENYLEGLSKLSVPADLERIKELSAEYGLRLLI